MTNTHLTKPEQKLETVNTSGQRYEEFHLGCLLLQQYITNSSVTYGPIMKLDLAVVTTAQQQAPSGTSHLSVFCRKINCRLKMLLAP